MLGTCETLLSFYMTILVIRILAKRRDVSDHSVCSMDREFLFNCTVHNALKARKPNLKLIWRQKICYKGRAFCRNQPTFRSGPAESTSRIQISIVF